MTIQNKVNFANFVSNFKQRKFLNQIFFQICDTASDNF